LGSAVQSTVPPAASISIPANVPAGRIEFAGSLTAWQIWRDTGRQAAILGVQHQPQMIRMGGFHE
jgi:hypothetical protein